MTRTLLALFTALITVLCVTSCGGNSAKTSPSTSSTTSRRSRPRAPTTTHPVTSTTRVNAVVADGFTQIALTNAIDASKALFLQSYDYTNVTPAALAAVDPGAHFGTLEQSNRTVIGVLSQDKNDILLVTRSPSGRWYCVTDNVMDGRSFGEGATRGSVGSNGECQQPAWPPPGQDQTAF